METKAVEPAGMTAQVKALYQKVQEQREKVLKAEKGSYVTDGIFRYSESGAVTDVKIVRDKRKLRDMLAFLLERDSFQTEASTRLGMTVETTWLGATTEQWENDFKVRATQLDIVAEKSKLNMIETELFKMCPELAQEVKFQELMSMLG